MKIIFNIWAYILNVNVSNSMWVADKNMGDGVMITVYWYETSRPFRDKCKLPHPLGRPLDYNESGEAMKQKLRGARLTAGRWRMNAQTCGWFFGWFILPSVIGVNVAYLSNASCLHDTYKPQMGNYYLWMVLFES